MDQAGLVNLIEPTLDPMGYALVRVRLSGGPRATLQVMAERLDDQPIGFPRGTRRRRWSKAENRFISASPAPLKSANELEFQRGLAIFRVNIAVRLIDWTGNKKWAERPTFFCPRVVKTKGRAF